MKVHCHTNLDLWNERWPTDLPAVPVEGQMIESMVSCGRFRLSLKVVNVTWKYSSTGYYPQIELHDCVERSITNFHKWYSAAVGRPLLD